MFAGKATAAYRNTHIASSPPRALVALLERLVRDASDTREAIETRDWLRKSASVGHALQILGELRAALQHETAPELCRNLTQLYEFCENELLRASLRSDLSAAGNAERVARTVCEAFREAVESGR